MRNHTVSTGTCFQLFHFYGCCLYLPAKDIPPDKVLLTQHFSGKFQQSFFLYGPEHGIFTINGIDISCNMLATISLTKSPLTHHRKIFFGRSKVAKFIGYFCSHQENICITDNRQVHTIVITIHDTIHTLIIILPKIESGMRLACSQVVESVTISIPFIRHTIDITTLVTLVIFIIERGNRTILSTFVRNTQMAALCLMVYAKMIEETPTTRSKWNFKDRLPIGCNDILAEFIPN